MNQYLVVLTMNGTWNTNKALFLRNKYDDIWESVNHRKLPDIVKKVCRRKVDQTNNYVLPLSKRLRCRPSSPYYIVIPPAPPVRRRPSRRSTRDTNTDERVLTYN
ncbi:unnamed protein product [Amoebophrya sp. A25]|nr:unnamed protein product [Amoebophrya sp. A25]|eukprot:GSA25T00002745001.1